MAIIREKKTIYLIFSYYTYTPKVKLNINWQMSILSKIVYVMDEIASFAALH